MPRVSVSTFRAPVAAFGLLLALACAPPGPPPVRVLMITSDAERSETQDASRRLAKRLAGRGQVAIETTSDAADLTPELPSGDGYGHRQVVREFVDVIRNGDPSQHSGRDGLYRAEIIDACYRSAELGSEVRLGH